MYCAEVYGFLRIKTALVAGLMREFYMSIDSALKDPLRFFGQPAIDWEVP